MTKKDKYLYVLQTKWQNPHFQGKIVRQFGKIKSGK